MADIDKRMEEIVSLTKRRGFIYPGSEVYGGLAGTWDYGPLGVALKNNIKRLWWKRFVDDRDDMFGMDAAIIMNPKVWEASGHVGGFSDPMVECLECKKRQRVDKLIDEAEYKKAVRLVKDPKFLDLTKNRINLPLEYQSKYFGEHPDFEVVKTYIEMVDDFERYTGESTQIFLNNYANCPEPKCGKKKWGVPRQFNMMLKTHVGANEDSSSVAYLRPETAQGMFVNFKNIIDTFHPRLPFGMAQIGKAFRNEIAPRDFTFRTREFEQMEIEYFVNESDWERAFEELRKETHAFWGDLGLPSSKVHELEVAKEDLAHYSKRTIDFEFDYPFGCKELSGLAYRTDFDLKAHGTHSCREKDSQYFDEESKERFYPHCIEPSFGLDRAVLAVLADAYTEDKMGGEKRTYLKLSPNVAPVRVAVFPLLKNKPELVAKAQEVFASIRKVFPNAMFDDNGNIGKRYRRQDEIGTPFCVTVDFETLEGKGVTVRDRDSGEQSRVSLDELFTVLGKK